MPQRPEGIERTTARRREAGTVDVLLGLASARDSKALAGRFASFLHESEGAVAALIWAIDRDAQTVTLLGHAPGTATAQETVTAPGFIALLDAIPPAGIAAGRELPGSPMQLPPFEGGWLRPLGPADGPAIAAAAILTATPSAPLNPPAAVEAVFSALLASWLTVERMQQSEVRYRSLAIQGSEMVLICDPADRWILDANPYAAEALGYPFPVLTTLRLDNLVVDDARAGLALPEPGREIRFAQRDFRRADGSTIAVDVTCSSIEARGREALLVVAHNLSERQQIDRQLMQAQKMEALSQMAGQVAHDFNNLLAAIMGFAGLVRVSPNLDAEQRENLRMIEEAAQRAGDLTGRLLAFARGNLVRFGPMDVLQILAGTLRLAAPSMSARIAVTLAAPTGELLVEGDAGQLQQAFLNILLNAGDALRTGGGTISITAGMANGRAVITFTDDGPGMPESVRLRIFEPFFTTKPAGSGTGLGLAITYGVIRAHHGTLHVQSAVGAGTSFTIELPLLAAKVEPQRTTPRLALIALSNPGDRLTARDAARKAGFATIEVEGPTLAPAMLSARPERFSLGVVDSLADPAYCATLLRMQPRLRLLTLGDGVPANVSG